MPGPGQSPRAAGDGAEEDTWPGSWARLPRRSGAQGAQHRPCPCPAPFATGCHRARLAPAPHHTTSLREERAPRRALGALGAAGDHVPRGAENATEPPRWDQGVGKVGQDDARAESSGGGGGVSPAESPSCGYLPPTLPHRQSGARAQHRSRCPAPLPPPPAATHPETPLAVRSNIIFIGETDGG